MFRGYEGPGELGREKKSNCCEQRWQHEPEIYPGGKFWQGQHRYFYSFGGGVTQSLRLGALVCPGARVLSQEEISCESGSLRHGPSRRRGAPACPVSSGCPPFPSRPFRSLFSVHQLIEPVFLSPPLATVPVIEAVPNRISK
jgi:hypothetical protein